GANEEQHSPIGSELARELERVLVERQGSLEVDDVDLVAMAEDVGRHLRVPVAGLVSEMDPGLEHLTHRYRHSYLLRVRSAAPSRTSAHASNRSTLMAARGIICRDPLAASQASAKF